MKGRDKGERRKIRRKRSGIKVTERSERRRITRKRIYLEEREVKEN